MEPFQIASFILISLGLGYLSRESLRGPRTHGFFRFFAWEAIAALALINLPAWFRMPFSWHQIISWLLLIISLYLVIEGLILLRKRGKPQASRPDPALLGLEKTTALVTSGLYRFIRHPLYASLLFLAWGVFFKLPSWAGFGLTALASYFLYRTARLEEKENLRFFGPEYQAYMQRSKMFIPYVL